MDKKEYINNPHDKIIRKILMNKKEGKAFINKALNLKEEEKLKEKNIENYTNSYVSNELKNKISDVVYKIVNKEEQISEVYIIIEHQSKKDKNMGIRMYEYKTLVIRQALDEIKKDTIAVFSNCLNIDKKELKEFLENLKEEEKDMMHIEEVLIRERDSWKNEGRKNGLVEARIKIIRKMIKGKVKDELIKEYTGINEKELEKIKKEMQNQIL